MQVLVSSKCTALQLSLDDASLFHRGRALGLRRRSADLWLGVIQPITNLRLALVGSSKARIVGQAFENRPQAISERVSSLGPQHDSAVGLFFDRHLVGVEPIGLGQAHRLAATRHEYFGRVQAKLQRYVSAPYSAVYRSISAVLPATCVLAYDRSDGRRGPIGCDRISKQWARALDLPVHRD